MTLWQSIWCHNDFIRQLGPSQCNKERKRRGIHIGKKDVKTSVLSSDMIFYIENPRESTKKKKKSLQNFLVSSARLHDTRLKSSVFLYISNKKTEIEILKYHL